MIKERYLELVEEIKKKDYKGYDLFKPFQVNGLKLKNRVIFLPCVMNLADPDGSVTDECIKRYLRIARGGVGWLIIECVVITPSKSPGNLRINDDRFIPGLRRLADTIHGETDCKIGIQAGHFLKIGRNWKEKVMEVSKERIKEIIQQHIDATKRIKRCGFDSVEWDDESYMTIASFLCRNNKRTDEYGGKLENRERLLMEQYEVTRDILGPDCVIGIRFNGDDMILGGNTTLHTTHTACELARRGVDYLSVTAGGRWEDAREAQPGEAPSAYTGYSGLRLFPRAWDPDGANLFVPEAIRKALRKNGYQTPVICAGKIPTAEFAEEILHEGKADLIGECRPILCDPDWVNKYLQGRPEDIVRCIYCNHCADVNDRFELTDCCLWPKGSTHAPDPFLPTKKRKKEELPKESTKDALEE
jgi:2,4-dienoyl-CoA reductase-like NADH-dependent reductase (Old Yellow Enzyme family)